MRGRSAIAACSICVVDAMIVEVVYFAELAVLDPFT